MTLEQRYIFYCILSAEIRFRMKSNYARDFDISLYYQKRDMLGTGLCHLISFEFQTSVWGDDMGKVLPELYAKRPRGAWQYWFSQDEDGWKKRLKLVGKCIKETELLISNQ